MTVPSATINMHEPRHLPILQCTKAVQIDHLLTMTIQGLTAPHEANEDFLNELQQEFPNRPGFLFIYVLSFLSLHSAHSRMRCKALQEKKAARLTLLPLQTNGVFQHHYLYLNSPTLSLIIFKIYPFQGIMILNIAVFQYVVM